MSLRERITLQAITGREAPTQAELARRFGVSQPAIANRLASIRTKLGDPSIGRFRQRRIWARPASLSLFEV